MRSKPTKPPVMLNDPVPRGPEVSAPLLPTVPAVPTVELPSFSVPALNTVPPL